MVKIKPIVSIKIQFLNNVFNRLLIVTFQKKIKFPLNKTEMHGFSIPDLFTDLLQKSTGRLLITSYQVATKAHSVNFTSQFKKGYKNTNATLP